MPVLRGFNMHVGPGFTWDQSHFDAIAARGGKINRAVLHWDQFEPTQGVVSRRQSRISTCTSPAPGRRGSTRCSSCT